MLARVTHTGMLAPCSCRPALAGDLSLGSAELVTFLFALKNRKAEDKSSLMENHCISASWLKEGNNP